MSKNTLREEVALEIFLAVHAGPVPTSKSMQGSSHPFYGRVHDHEDRIVFCGPGGWVILRDPMVFPVGTAPERGRRVTSTSWGQWVSVGDQGISAPLSELTGCSRSVRAVMMLIS